MELMLLGLVVVVLCGMAVTVIIINWDSTPTYTPQNTGEAFYAEANSKRSPTDDLDATSAVGYALIGLCFALMFLFLFIALVPRNCDNEYILTTDDGVKCEKAPKHHLEPQPPA